MTEIRFAEPHDVAVIPGFVRALAEFEREPDAVVATEPTVQRVSGDALVRLAGR
jgi:hypothetical protein